MKLNIQNSKNETVGTIELNDDVFGGRVKTDLDLGRGRPGERAERRGTHATKNRALVSGGGKKPYKQKGTGRPQVGLEPDAALAQGRHGVRPAAAQLRVRHAEEGAGRRAARGARAEAERRRRHRRRQTRDRPTARRRAPRRCCGGLGVSGKTLVIDVKPDEKFALSARNIAGVTLVPAAGSRARDIMDTAHVIATREAIEKLQESAGIVASCQ